MSEEAVFEATDDFDDTFSVLHDPAHPDEWIAEVEEDDWPGVRRSVILRRPQIEELYAALGRSLGGGK